MFDRTVPYYKLLMDKTDSRQYPRFTLPPGYSFCFYRPGMEQDWMRIQCRSGHLLSLAEAEAAFEQHFAAHQPELARRCLFILDPNDTPVATAAIWPGQHFGRELQRFHWVAVAQEQQGKGLAKALVTRLLDLYHQLGYEGYLYLTTQTGSYPAVQLYLRFGFKPYRGQPPANWPSANFEAENPVAWQIVEQKLGKPLPR